MTHIAGELLRGNAGFAGLGEQICESIRDGVVVIERKVWVWPDRTHRQDTWWMSSHTDDCRTVEMNRSVRETIDRFGPGPWPKFIAIRTDEIAPVELPHQLLDVRNARMRIGLFKIDVSMHLRTAPWYVDAFKGAA